MILLSSKLVSKACGIHHCLLGFLLCILGCNKHAINFSLQGVNRGFQLALGSHVASIDGLHIVDCTTCISNVSLELALSTLSTIQRALLSSTSPERDAALRSDIPTCSEIWAFARASSSKSWIVSLSCP